MRTIDMPEGAKVIVWQRDSGYCTDELDHKYIEDAAEILGTKRAKDHLDKADELVDDPSLGLEELIDLLDFIAHRMMLDLRRAGYRTAWNDGYIIYEESE